jgi:hypothetical protein
MRIRLVQTEDLLPVLHQTPANDPLMRLLLRLGQQLQHLVDAAQYLPGLPTGQHGFPPLRLQ